MMFIVRGFALATLCSAVSAQTTDQRPVAVAQDAVDAIIEAFEQYDVVLLGEQHQGVEFHALLAALIHDPRFARVVDDIMVEFGNSRLQPIADRWVNGAPLSEAELVSMWRETTQPFVWNSPVYERFFRSVRAINEPLKPEMRVRNDESRAALRAAYDGRRGQRALLSAGYRARRGRR